MKKILFTFFILLGAMSCSKIEQTVSGEGEVSDQIERLDIDWVNGMVEITYWEGNTIKFYEESAEPTSYDQTMCWYETGRTLRIRYCKSYTRKGFPKTLHVMLPDGKFFRELDVNTTDAEVFCDIDCEDVEIETVSGPVFFYTLAKRSDVEIETVSGDVTLGLPTYNGFYCTYTTLSGDLYTEFPLAGQHGHYEYLEGGASFEVTTVSGNLNLIINR